MGLSSKEMKLSSLGQSTRRISTKSLVMASILCSISIILTRYFSITILDNTVRLGFGNLPVIFSGLLLGPLPGALTGFVSDFLGMMLNPSGTFHPGISLSAALTGFIPGMVATLNPKGRFSLSSVVISHLLVYVLISLGLTTLWLSQLMGKGFMVLLPARALGSGITSVISIAISLFLAQFLKQNSNF